MKSLLLFFLGFISIFFASNAQDKYAYIITLHPDDCVSCLNTLSNIIGDTQATKTFVFREEFENDKDILLKDLFLEEFRDKVIFSDSLFNTYKNPSDLQQSSVSLYNPANNRHITIPLTAFENSVDFKNYFKSVDTIHVEETIDAYKVTNDKLFVFDFRRKKVGVYSRLNRQQLYEITFEDSLLLQGYQARFGKQTGLTIFEKAREYINRKKIIGGSSKLESLQVRGDTVWLMLSQPEIIFNKYPIPPDNPDNIDTVVNRFFSLYRFLSGSLKNVNQVENYRAGEYIDSPGLRRDRLKKDRFDAFFPMPIFFTHEKRLFIEVTSSYLTIGSPNWVLAEYKLDNSGKFNFHEFTAELPDIYTDTSDLIAYNYISHSTWGFLHFGPYFTFPMSDSIYSVDDKYSPIALPPISRKKGSIFPYISDFLVDNGYLYLLLLEKKGGAFFRVYLKYDIKNEKVVFKNRIPEAEKHTNSFPFIDRFDYSYIYIEDKGNVIRYKVE